MNVFIKKDGFTLIELLVGISSFIVIISIAVGGFVMALRSQRQAISLMNLNNNISLVLEQIVREIRTGYNFCQNTSYPCSINQFSFTNGLGQLVIYRFNNNNIEKQINDFGFKRIMANDINVLYLNFIYSGIAIGDNLQPRITILIGASPKEKQTSNIITNIQTTISPRVLDG